MKAKSIDACLIEKFIKLMTLTYLNNDVFQQVMKLGGFISKLLLDCWKNLLIEITNSDLFPIMS